MNNIKYHLLGVAYNHVYNQYYLIYESIKRQNDDNLILKDTRRIPLNPKTKLEDIYKIELKAYKEFYFLPPFSKTLHNTRGDMSFQTIFYIDSIKLFLYLYEVKKLIR